MLNVSPKSILIFVGALGLSLGLSGVFSTSVSAQGGFPADPYRELISMDSDPFWRRPKQFKRLDDERAILVSVKSQKKRGEELRSLRVLGAGVVRRHLDQCYTILKDFSRWKEMSDYIKASDYDPQTKILKLHLVAFNYHAHLNLRIFFDEPAPPVAGESAFKAIRFLVLDGSFKDLKGLLEFKDHGRRKTEISMLVTDEFETLPLPAFFLEFGLEIVFQKIAERMRSFIEINTRPL